VKKRIGRTPQTVTADRGYGEAKVDQQLTDLGVKNVVIPRKGEPSQARRVEEHRKAFRRIVNGGPAAKAASATLNAVTTGTASASTAPKEHASGPWSRPKVGVKAQAGSRLRRQHTG
jgi:IS5 family transposase